ncbi:MAG: DUF1211 domain-containing protein [Clostridia bacterium]|nr:DUF1211 domain-containing protein [Clostridia bacterium]
MEKNRLEAFSDGVLAIVITIMVLELSLPAGDGLKDFADILPLLLTYLLSFFFVAIYWVNHHLIFNVLGKTNLKIIWVNIIWLFVISLIPFTTAWAGKYPTSFAPLSVYFSDMALASIAFHVLYFLIMRQNGEKCKLGLRSIVSLVVYTSAAAVGGFCPVAAFIVVAIVSCWWVFPERKKKPQV